MTLVLDLPPHLEVRLRAEADAQGRDAASVAADRLLASFATTDQVAPLRPFSTYASEADYITEAREKAPFFGISPNDAAAMAEGIADGELGRTMALEDYITEQKAAREARRRKREAADNSAASIDD